MQIKAIGSRALGVIYEAEVEGHRCSVRCEPQRDLGAGFSVEFDTISERVFAYPDGSVSIGNVGRKPQNGDDDIKRIAAAFAGEVRGIALLRAAKDHDAAEKAKLTLKKHVWTQERVEPVIGARGEFGADLLGRTGKVVAVVEYLGYYGLDRSQRIGGPWQGGHRWLVEVEG